MLCIELIGKYSIRVNKEGRQYVMKCKKDKDINLQAITMIDPATSWVGVCSVPEARTHLAANKVEPAWSTILPLPTKITVSRGKDTLVLLLQHKS